MHGIVSVQLQTPGERDDEKNRKHCETHANLSKVTAQLAAFATLVG